MQEVDGISPEYLSGLVDADKLQAIETDCEDMLENNYLESLYGNISTMDHTDWMTKS